MHHVNRMNRNIDNCRRTWRHNTDITSLDYNVTTQQIYKLVIIFWPSYARQYFTLLPRKPHDLGVWGSGGVGVGARAEVESSWNVMEHGEVREGKWRGNWRMQWVASTLHTTSEHGVSSITTADAHTSAASSRINWRPRRFKWTRPFSRKTKSGFCACAITFQTQSTSLAVASLVQRKQLQTP